jgi:hypothetical protein
VERRRRHRASGRSCCRLRSRFRSRPRSSEVGGRQLLEHLAGLVALTGFEEEPSVHRPGSGRFDLLDFSFFGFTDCQLPSPSIEPSSGGLGNRPQGDEPVPTGNQPGTEAVTTACALAPPSCSSWRWPWPPAAKPRTARPDSPRRTATRQPKGRPRPALPAASPMRIRGPRCVRASNVTRR